MLKQDMCHHSRSRKARGKGGARARKDPKYGRNARDKKVKPSMPLIECTRAGRSPREKRLSEKVVWGQKVRNETPIDQGMGKKVWER